MKSGIIAIIALASPIWIILALNYCYSRWTIDEIVITVTGKERITEGGVGSINSLYLVHGKDETFENADSIFHLKWNSTDVQREIVIGKTYHAKVYGWRMPFFSSYRNIVLMKGVSDE